MNHRTRLLLPLLVGGLAGSPLALAEDPDCDKLSLPKSIEGQVIKVDAERGKVSVRASDGTTHEFEATKETLQTYKNGDTIKANLRTPPKCVRK